MSDYRDFNQVEELFFKELGNNNNADISKHLLVELSKMVNKHFESSMCAYYASSIINKFYRKRRALKTLQIFDYLYESLLEGKCVLIEIMRRIWREEYAYWPKERVNYLVPIISTLPEGYYKSNQFLRFGPMFKEKDINNLLESISCMNTEFKIRAYSGIFERTDALMKDFILKIFLTEFLSNSGEAFNSLSRAYKFLDQEQRELVNVEMLKASEGTLTAFIQNNKHELPENFCRLAVKKIINFRSDYLRNKCLTVVKNHVDAGLVEKYLFLLEVELSNKKPTTQLIHSWYHLTSLTNKYSTEFIVSSALNYISNIDDSYSEIYSQEKYFEICFICRHLKSIHAEQAYDIVKTIKGGYRRSALSRLNRHFIS